MLKQAWLCARLAHKLDLRATEIRDELIQSTLRCRRTVKWEVTPKTVGYSQQLVFHPLSSQEFGSLYDNRL